MSPEITLRLTQEPDPAIPLKDRLDLPRLKAACREKLYMPDFIYTSINNFRGLPQTVFNSCGTIGCIAGNVILNELGENKSYEAFRRLDIPEIARHILGLTENEALGLLGTGLFFVCYPTPPPGTPKYNAEVIKHVKKWLKVRGVEWGND